MALNDAASYVEHLLGYQPFQPTQPDPSDFATAVRLLVNDGLSRPVAVRLMEDAKGRRENVLKRAEQMVASRAKYRQMKAMMP